MLIIYGPYIALFEGRYRVQFDLSQVGDGERHVRLVVTADNGRTALAEKEVALATEPNPVLELDINGSPNVEFRVYGGVGTRRFAGVAVEQGPEGGR